MKSFRNLCLCFVVGLSEARRSPNGYSMSRRFCETREYRYLSTGFADLGFVAAVGFFAAVLGDFAAAEDAPAFWIVTWAILTARRGLSLPGSRAICATCLTSATVGSSHCPKI